MQTTYLFDLSNARMSLNESLSKLLKAIDNGQLSPSEEGYLIHNTMSAINALDEEIARVQTLVPEETCDDDA
jgi:hypothetical protein